LSAKIERKANRDNQERWNRSDPNFDLTQLCWLW